MTFRLSFEFFPLNANQPNSKLLRAADRLNQTNPDFFSVTYGAGGSTKHRTERTVKDLLGQGLTTFPHLSWGEESEQEMVEMVKSFLNIGVKGLVVLRGDIPSGSMVSSTHHANELVALVRKHCGNDLELFVAAYPEVHPDALDTNKDLDYLHQKVSAGASACITQYFYNVDAYGYFVDACRRIGIKVPIFPGIMPIYNYTQLVQFSRNCGAEIPRWIERRMYDYRTDKESLENFGVDVVTALCSRLMAEGAPGFHIYTLNRALIPRRILKNLGIYKETP